MLYTPAFWAMALANLCHTASFSAFFLLPLYILEHGGNQGDIGVVMGIFALASAISRPWVAEMIDRIGRKRSYTLGSILMLASPFLYLGIQDPLGTAYPPFLLLRALHGVGLAICFTSVFTFMADILPRDRLNEGIGMFGISGLIGIAIGPILAEIMLEHFGFAGLFIVAGILSGISLIIHQPLKESAPTGEKESDPTTFFGLFRREKFIVVGLISLLFGVGLAGSGNFVAPLAEERNLGFISVYFFCYSGGAITIRFVNGWLSVRFGENRILPCSIVLYMAGLFLLPLAYNQAVLCVAGILSGIGHGLLFPLLNTMAVRDERSSIRGKATGIFTGGIDSGIFAGSLILGYIGEWFGLNVLFLCAGLSMTIALIIFRFHRPDSCN
ncbi:MFS transporter [Deltaproteobacteria bacterium IMCC39524]|nr:MFS transporter [Deltaproteobacteria bacterium IMCC39524]